MRGCLFTLLLAAIVAGFVVVVGLPVVAAGLLTAGLSAAGLVADDTTVTVSSDPPTDLLGLHADTVRVTATDATFRGLEMGSLDLTLGQVAVLERSAGTVDGELRDVTVRGTGGRSYTLDRVTLQGGSDGITTTTVVPNAEVEAMIADAVEAQSGVRPTSVELAAPDRLTVVASGATLRGTFAVNGRGDLVVRGDDAFGDARELTLVRGGEDLPIELTSVRVTRDGGLRLTGDLAVGILG
jgi:hypothetical protein